MKLFLKIIGVFVVLGILAHTLVWFIDRDLHASKKAEVIPFEQDQLELRHIRMNLEAEQKKELDSYGSKGKDQVWVEVPVERAYDYYLDSLPR